MVVEGGGAVVVVVVGAGGVVVVVVGAAGGVDVGSEDFDRVAAQIATPSKTSRIMPPTTAAIMMPPLGERGVADGDPTDAEPVAVIPDISSCLIDEKFIPCRLGCKARHKSFGFLSSWLP